jgi:26S proteasome regulatory subunit N6
VAIQGPASLLAAYIRSLESAWSILPRAKTARLLRSLLDLFTHCPDKQVEMQLASELVAWCVRDKRAYLKQTLEFRLAALYLDNRMYTDALTLVGQLLRELKRMEDKLTLVEVHLLECRIYFALRNGPKAKAALTAARSNANSIYCPPLIQAALDMQSALVYVDENDFKTAYSFFYEALDSYASQEDPRGATALKYLLLCKIMLGHAEELDGIANGKLGQKYSLGLEVSAMKAVGEAHRNKSLREFEEALGRFPEQLGTDMMIHAHFQSLYDQLLQQNLLRVISSYSKVQLTFVAQSIGLPVDVVESKLSMMILDKQLSAIIDQHEQCLVLLETPVHDKTFQIALETVKHLDSAVEALYKKATQI